jgi:GNAT superfamily N-acetyltransferase
MSVVVRSAAPADLAAVIRLLGRFHKENTIDAWASDRVLESVCKLMTEQDLLVAELDSALVGVLGIVEYKPWYSHDRHLVDQPFYVVPEQRGGKVGQMLADAAREIATQRGLPLSIVVHNPRKAAKRGRVADIIGFIPEGYVVSLTGG